MKGKSNSTKLQFSWHLHLPIFLWWIQILFLIDPVKIVQGSVGEASEDVEQVSDQIQLHLGMNKNYAASAPDQLTSACHYKPRLVYFLPPFSAVNIKDNLCTKQGNVGLKSARTVDIFPKRLGFYTKIWEILTF